MRDTANRSPAPRAGAHNPAARPASAAGRGEGIATATQLDRLYTSLETRIGARLRDALAASRAASAHAASSIAPAPSSLLDSIAEHETVGLREKEGRLRRAGDPEAADLVRLARLKMLPRVVEHLRTRLVRGSLK